MELGRKLERKIKKFVYRIKNAKDINCMDTPTANVALCNVGQATGFKKTHLENMISKHCPGVKLIDYIAEKGQSHSFAVFSDSKNAELFFNVCNATELDNGPQIYMVFVENLPKTEIVCKDERPIGLTIITEFITKEEEINFINVFDWNENNESASMKNRQVKHYGYEFRYGSNDVDIESPLHEHIPVECNIFWTRLKHLGIEIERPPDQLTVNKYLPGQGIPSHVDKHSPFLDTILSLSLGSEVVMDWRHHSGKYVPVLIPQRSMLIMKDDARYDWQHGIQPRSWDPVLKESFDDCDQKQCTLVTNDVIERGTRISLTFRWINKAVKCECKYKTLCDSAEKETADIDNRVASKLEELHVHQVYEQIAGHFSTTRHKPWPKVVEFMKEVSSGSIVLDLGCGNGKNILRRHDIIQLACERSCGLMAECKQHCSDIPRADCIRVDLLNTTLRDACVDVVICIAVIHHFSSIARRLQAIETISRLLKKGGKALITVWAKDQTKSNYLAKNKADQITEEKRVSVHGVNLPVHENRTQFKHNDLLVPWKLRQLGKDESKLEGQPQCTLLRYYHVFEDNELVKLCETGGTLVVESSFYEEGNWCVVCKKI